MTDSSNRLPVWLIALFVGAFAIGTDDFVIAGILPDVAADLDVTEAAAGQLVTAFSLAYAVGAPVAAVVTSRWSRRTVMVTAMSFFAAGNLLAAVVDDFGTLLVVRILLALAAATVTPAAVATAASLAPNGRQGRYIGVVAAGLTVSLAAGVPMGTWLGGAFGWRSTMVFVAALAVLALLGMVRLPVSVPPPAVRLWSRLAPLRRPAIAVALVTVLIAASGGLMFYEYIAPVARALSGVGADGLAVMIAVTGVCGAVGTWIGGRATDRFGPERTTLVAVAFQAGAILSTGLLALSVGSIPVVLLGGLMAVWAMAGWAFNPAMYLRLIKLSGDAGAEVAGLNNSALFLGISAAGGIGGAVLAAWGATAVPMVSGLLSLVGLAMFALSFRLFDPQRVSLGGRP